MKSDESKAARLERLNERLKLATSQFASARNMRDRVIVQAHEAGLSVRKIATTTGLSPSRVHQVIRAEAAHEDQADTAPPRSLSSRSLSKISLFTGLDESSLEALGEQAVIRNFPKHAILINQGDYSDSLYLILEGRVQIFASSSKGKELLLTTLESGDCFGELALLDEQPRSASARALEPCEMLVLPKTAFIDCICQYPIVALELMRRLSAMVRQEIDRAKGLALNDVYERLVQVLLEIGEERDGVTVVDNITHKSLAERVYATREMVTLILRDLKQGGYIDVGNHRITIKKHLPARW